MSPERMDEAARRLADLRRRGEVARRLPPELVPASLAEAYAIQDRFRALWGAPVAAWKIGATAKPVQARFGVDEPFAGPVFAPDVLESPAAPAAAAFPHHCIECEFAFRLGRALPARAKDYTRAEVIEAVDAAIPAFELIGPRFEDLLFDQAATAVADCALNAGLVLGLPQADWRGLDLPGHAVRLTVAGELRAAGTGASVLGDPLNVLEWAVNHLSGRGIGLAVGQIVSTGTATGIQYLAPGETAVADFGPLGRIEVCFSGPPHPRPMRPLG
jgi:2-keto-4-pentenoate hydratase